MFEPQKLYSMPELAKAVSRSTRTIAKWRERGLIPKPDALLGGRYPAWWGSTLNEARAFEAPTDELVGAA